MEGPGFERLRGIVSTLGVSDVSESFSVHPQSFRSFSSFVLTCIFFLFSFFFWETGVVDSVGNLLVLMCFFSPIFSGYRFKSKPWMGQSNESVLHSCALESAQLCISKSNNHHIRNILVSCKCFCLISTHVLSYFLSFVTKEGCFVMVASYIFFDSLLKSLINSNSLVIIFCVHLLLVLSLFHPFLAFAQSVMHTQLAFTAPINFSTLCTDK